MAYVFYANKGALYPFDVEVALDSVHKLQQEIADIINVSINNQVLLISDGQLLQATNRICSYNGAGTIESSPIFLFNKASIESPGPPPCKPITYNIRWTESIESALNMPETVHTVATRAELALQLSKEDEKVLDELIVLVRDQHLQHAAWKAVIANLFSVADSLKKRLKTFDNNCCDYISKREKYLTTLNRLDHVLPVLKYIPVIRRLLPNGDDDSETAELSLLDWITTQDASCNLSNMIEDCNGAIKKLNENFYKEIIGEMVAVVEAVDNQDMIEVKGIETRFTNLSQLQSTGKGIVQNQTEMAQGFVQNNDRIQHLNDESVLPDLCQSHAKQLKQLHSNHKKLVDIYLRCFRSKAELSNNLHSRLQWVILLEKSIYECDSRLVIHHQTLKHLRHRLSILEQIHSSPEVYLKLLSETVRRWEFSVNVMHWASRVYAKSQGMLQDEVTKRKDFTDWVGKHFLLHLFPGLGEYPLTYSHQPPKTITTCMPSISRDDLDLIRSQLRNKSKLDVSLEKLAKEFIIIPQNSLTGSGKFSSTSENNRFEYIDMEDNKDNTQNTTSNDGFASKYTKDSSVEVKSKPTIAAKADNVVNHSQPTIEKIVVPREHVACQCNIIDVEFIAKAKKCLEQWKAQYVVTGKLEFEALLREVKKNRKDVDKYVCNMKDRISDVLTTFLTKTEETSKNSSLAYATNAVQTDESNSENSPLNTDVNANDEGNTASDRLANSKLEFLVQQLKDLIINNNQDTDLITFNDTDALDRDIEYLIQTVKRLSNDNAELKHLKEELSTVRASREPLAIIEMREQLDAKERECCYLRQQIETLSSFDSTTLPHSSSCDGISPMKVMRISKSISDVSAILNESKRINTEIVNDGKDTSSHTLLADTLDAAALQTEKIHQELYEVLSEQSVNIVETTSDAVKSPPFLSEVDALKAEINYLKEKLDEKFKFGESPMNLALLTKVVFQDIKVNNYVILTLDTANNSYKICTSYQQLYKIHPKCVDKLRRDLGDAPPPWVIGQVEKMEYCQARKEENRFNLPINHKFFLAHVQICCEP